MPDGEAAPVDGWSEATSQAGDRAEDTCASGGGLVAGLEAGRSHAADTDLATWSFEAPAGETLAAATLWRAGDTAGGGNEDDAYFFWLTGVANSGENTVLFDKCNAYKDCPSEGNLKNALAANNRIEVPEKALHSPYLSLNASCGSLISGSECDSSPGDENGYAAVIELFAADLVLTQETSPTVQEVKGPLAEATTVSGTSDIAFKATDSGSGIYEAIIAVDGKTVASTILSTNGGRCHNVGQTTDGLPAFLYTQPCPAALSVDVPFDTTTLSNGSHHLVVSVTDAAGNSTPVVNREVTVANATGESTSPPGGSPTTPTTPTAPTTPSLTLTPNPSSPPPSTATPAQPPRGAANGSEASDAASLSAYWRGAARESARLESAYGQAHTIAGTLQAPDGRPIAGAAIEVTTQAASAGARAIKLPAAHTDAQGHFSIGLARNASSLTVNLAYRSHVGDPLPAATRTLTLAVRPKLALHITPRLTAQGRTIRFSGSLAGGYIPPGGKQLVLEGRSPGASWTEFDVVRTNAAGAFHATHRFRLPGPVAYSFRVVSGYEADYPFLGDSSNVVEVRER
jgi:hypothetical protein